MMIDRIDVNGIQLMIGSFNSIIFFSFFSTRTVIYDILNYFVFQYVCVFPISISFLRNVFKQKSISFLFICPLGSHFLFHTHTHTHTNRNLICIHAHANDDGVSIVRLIEKLMKQIFSSNHYYNYHRHHHQHLSILYHRIKKRMRHQQYELQSAFDCIQRKRVLNDNFRKKKLLYL